MGRKRAGAPSDTPPVSPVGEEGDRPAEGQDGGYTLTLPLAPSVNHAYRSAIIGGKSRRVATAKVKEYKADVAVKARMQRARLLDGEVSLSLAVYFPDRRRRDLSNVVKVCEDSLTGICYRDDSQIHHMELVKRYDRGNPRIELTVRPYAAASLPAAA